MMLGKEEPGHNRDISIPLMDDEVVMDVEEDAGHDRQYKDVFFLALFGMNILCIISLALLYGVVALSSSGDKVIKVGQNGKEYNQTSEFTPSVEIMFGMIVTLASAVIATSVWIFTLSRIASFVLNAILISLIMVPIICGMVLFFLGYFVFGFTLLLLSVCLLVLSLFIRPRMDFAAVNLRVACTAVLQMPSVFGYAGMAVGVQVLFSILWGIAAVGYATSNTDVTIHAHGLNYNLDECTTYLYGDTLSVPNYGTLTCSGGTCSACVCDGTYISSHACLRPRLYGWAYFWLLVSLFWTSAVVANVVHCTVAAAVARWWEVGYPSHLTVEHGFKRATTTSLGSICFASLLVAVVRSLRSVVHFLSKQLASTQTTGLLRSLQMCLVRVLLYFLALLDRLVVYFNRYALCFVAIHRTDFLTASKTATALFVQRGFTTLLNDDIIDVVLQIGHLIIGIVAMCVGYVYGRLSGVGYAYTVLLTVFGFAAGYLISVVALSTVSSAVATVYVCYVERPLQLQVSHPELYVPLSEAWTNLAPTRNGDGSKRGTGPADPHSSAGGQEAPGIRPETPSSGGSASSAATRIRGSFGSEGGGAFGGGGGGGGGGGTARSQFEIAGSSAQYAQGGASTSPEGGGAFAAGFALIAALFPSAATVAPAPAGQRMNTATEAPGRMAGATTLRGGYAALQRDDADTAPQQMWGPAPQHSVQHQQAAAWPSSPSPGYAPLRPLQHPQQFSSAQPHHWGPPAPQPYQQQAPSQQFSQQQAQPAEPLFAHAFTALNSLTNRLSTSVFGSPRYAAGVHTGQGQHHTGGTGPRDEAATSLMSVQLEESFAV